MKMVNIPKKYGQSKIDKCPFCGKQSIVLNRQNVPVCLAHKEETLENLKCACGSYLEMLKGKYGIFFSCIKCGNLSIGKALELNAVKPANNASEGKKEITVRSDDPRYFD